MVFEISCLILEKKQTNLSVFDFFKTVILGIFLFWAKTSQTYKSCSKNGQNLQIAVLFFTFHPQNPLFDVDLFSPNFDIELPPYKRHLTGQI